MHQKGHYLWKCARAGKARIYGAREKSKSQVMVQHRSLLSCCCAGAGGGKAHIYGAREISKACAWSWYNTGVSCPAVVQGQVVVGGTAAYF